MDKIRNRKLYIGAVFIPALFTAISFFSSPYWIIGTAVSLFVLVGTLPFCRHRENLWMFVFVAFFSIPTNIAVSIKTEQFLFGEETFFLTLVYTLMIFFAYFSVTEIVFAAVTRMIWKRQFRLFPREFDD